MMIVGITSTAAMSIGTSNRLAMRSLRASTNAVIRRARLRSSTAKQRCPGQRHRAEPYPPLGRRAPAVFAAARGGRGSHAMPFRTSHVAASQNRDATSRQRWRVVEGGITAARKALTAAKTKRDRQTGARKGAVLGLTWADVDVPGRTLRIERQLERQGKR